MRAVAPETASQVALRNCSKEVGRKVSIHVIFGEGGIRAIKPFFFFFLQKVSATHETPHHHERV